MDERRSFFESAASGWDELLDRDLNKKKLAEMVSLFGVCKGDAILDVGTGTGVLLPLIGHASGPEGTVVAIDFSFNMLVAASSHHYSVRPAFLNAGVGAIPFRQGSFDKVSCFNAFPHFPDKKKALTEMVRVLKQGGSLFIAHLNSVEEIAQLHHDVGGSVRGDHLPDRETMGLLMAEAGLQDMDVQNKPGWFLARGKKG